MTTLATTLAFVAPKSHPFWDTFFKFSPAQSTNDKFVIKLGNSAKEFSSPEIFLQGEIVPGWVLTKPLLINLERDEDNTIIASDDLFYVYGCGDTTHEAMNDYAISLTEYFAILSSHDDLDSQTLLNVLKQYLHPILTR